MAALAGSAAKPPKIVLRQRPKLNHSKTIPGAPRAPTGESMLELTIEQISMGQSAVDKSAALQLLARHLVADGLVDEGYLAGLQAREAQGSTFLGQGIAIPHGTPETRELVFTTGVRLMQFPDGVDWGDGHIVYLAIGIAAKS